MDTRADSETRQRSETQRHKTNSISDTQPTTGPTLHPNRRPIKPKLRPPHRTETQPQQASRAQPALKKALHNNDSSIIIIIIRIKEVRVKGVLAREHKTTTIVK